MKNGHANRRQSGTKRYQTIMIATRPTVMRKSTKLVMTEPAGMIRRGKVDLGNEVGIADQAVA